MSDRYVRVALMRQWVRPVGAQQKTEVTLEDTLQIEVAVDALRRGRAWRAALDAALAARGVRPAEVVSVNLLASPQFNCHVVVTLAPVGTLEDLQRRRRAVTRGGRPIGPPERRRTRATLRRGG